MSPFDRYRAQQHDREEWELAELRRQNNPHNEPTGHWTGRCARCGSNDIWDDNLAYGCNKCGAFLAGN